MGRVLVTGGAGFLGSHLCDALLAAGHEVTALDDLSTGTKANLQAAGAHARFHFEQADVLQPLRGQYDRLYHLACPASPAQYRRDPVRTLKVAVTGTLQALELAAQTGARLLLASTSEVYGDPLVHPQPESYFGNVDTQGTRACYDEGKRAAETLVADFVRTRQVDARTARIFNTYGPRMALADGRVVTNFIVAALQGKPLQLTGGGGQGRSFCYVDDLIAGLTGLMETRSAHASAPTNLGMPQQMSVRELAHLVIRLTGSKSTLADTPGEAGDPARRCPDISRARAMFGFDPKTGLEQGLLRTIDYARGALASAATLR